jgi:hypothetical protein
MSFYPVAVNQVLAKINQTTPVEIEETNPGHVKKHHGDAEWFLLESADLEDYDLYDLLRRNWHGIVGLGGKDFALIYCRHDPDSGVWLHYSPKPYFVPGCRQIPSWLMSASQEASAITARH